MPRNYGQGRVYQRPGSRNLHIACCIDGKEYRESARSPKRSAANALLIKRLAEVQSGIWVPNKNIHVGQLLDLFLADYERNGKSLDWATIVVGHLRPFFGSMLARQLGTNAIETYVEKRRQAGRRNSTHQPRTQRPQAIIPPRQGSTATARGSDTAHRTPEGTTRASGVL